MTANGHKSQSALEYMMTYGWAILIIVIVAGVLYSLGIFNPAASASTTVTGLSGFQTTAVCATNGTIVIELGNGLGYTVNVTQINTTYNGKTISNPQSVLLSPGSAYTFFSLSGCTQSATTRFSTSVAVSYTEPGRTFPGPYFSSGVVAGTSSSFSQGTVANVTNGTFLYAQASVSLNKVWGAGKKYTLVGWFNAKAMALNGRPSIGDSLGCVSSMFQLKINATFFSVYANEWNNTADSCSGGTVSQQTGPVYAPYNKWVMLTDIFSYKPPGWIEVCYDTTCVNSTWTLNGPANYSAPTAAATELDFDGLLGKVADIQVYSSVLSQTQIQELYNLGYGGIPVTSQSLAAWWPLNGNLLDFSGNSNTASQSGGTLSWVSP